MQGNCLAQNKLDSINSVYITLTPTALLNYHQGIQGGVEVGIDGFGYLEAEATYFINFDFSVIKGQRFSLTYKFPLTKSNDIKLILAGQYRKSTHQDMDDFDRAAGAFFQNITYGQERELFGGTLGFSYCLNLRKIGQVEFGARVGGGAINITNDELPLYAVRFRDNLTINGRYLNGGNFSTPLLGMSVKLKFKVI